MTASKPYSIMVIVLVLLFSKILCAPSSELIEHSKSLAENQDTTVSNLVKTLKQAWQDLDDSLYSPVDAKKLKQYMAGILFHFKNRHCESIDKTFFNDRCRRIGSHHYCPNNLMVLFDSPNNEGDCDCRDDLRGNNGLPPIFSNLTGMCHFPFTQGPCKLGEWFVIKDKFPACEPIPGGCPADGRHVYAKLNGTEGSRKCWNTRSNDNCPEGQTVRVVQNPDNGELTVHCSCYLKTCNSNFIQPDEPVNSEFDDATASGSLANKNSRYSYCPRIGKKLCNSRPFVG